MIRNVIATLCCSVLSCALFAQNGWLPPVNLPSNTYLCDPSDWKLVMYDNFDGNTLSSNWVTYTSWAGMYVIRNGDTIHTADHPNWPGARTCNSNALFKNSNVWVSNGSCKIGLQYDPGNTWTVIDSTNANYPDSTHQRDYSTGTINTPYLLPNGQTNTYNSGRFEARIKFPDFKNAWCAFWLWHGSSVNEIDIAEMWGGVHPTNPFVFGDKTRTQFNLHAWGPGDNNPNPYSLPDDADMSNGINTNYPRQGWIDWYFGNQFRTENWHTYTCEWDTAVIKAYVDNQLSFIYWKYSKQVKVFGRYVTMLGSSCNPAPGSWNITYGYPWNDNSVCQLRISGGFGAEIKKPNSHNMRDNMGQIWIDNVKIWQKHPEKDNHAELCAANTYPTTPTISGPEEICPLASYTLSPATTGYWSTFNSNILVVGSPTSNSCDLAKDAGSAFNNGWVAYNYGNGVPGCPPKSVYKYGLHCNRSTDWMVVSPFVSNNVGEGRFHFIANLYHRRDVVGGTTPIVEWNIAINPGKDYYDKTTAIIHNLKGQYASSSSFQMNDNQSYNLKWTMNVTDASGTWSRSGERNSKTPLWQQRNDTNTYYVNAYIDDQKQYDTTVYYGVASNMISEEEFADTLFVNELIEKVKADALEPYLITDGMEEMMRKNGGDLGKPNEEGNTSAIKSKLKIYPNPVRSNITIIADARFVDKQPVTIHVYDLAGKLFKRGNVHYSKGSIMNYDLSGIADGNYILELQQGHLNEHIKIIKAKN